MADVKISALPNGAATATSLVPVVNGGVTQRATVQGIVDLAKAAIPPATVNTVAVGSTVGLTSSPNLPLQQWADEMAQKAAFQSQPVAFSNISSLAQGYQEEVSFTSNGWIFTGGLYTNRLFYGGQELRAGGTPNGYELPTPTGDGYLRADQDPATGWYFAEPVVVSDTEPPAPAGGNAIWIDPTGTSTGAGTGEFTTDSPITFKDSPILEQEDGTPIGLSADGLTFHQPLITGAIPVMIGGKKYLIPICDA